MEIGKFIRIKHNINGSDYKYSYYKLCEGYFEITHQNDGLIGKFEGKYFLCQGSDYFVNMFGKIFGLELLEGQFEVINDLPNNLIL
jgi:hypothetical protein